MKNAIRCKTVFSILEIFIPKKLLIVFLSFCGVVFVLKNNFLIASTAKTDMNIATNSSMYKVFATYYDQFYQSKNYEKECVFLQTVFSKFCVKTVLDVGCGTGTHLSVLEQCGYSCEGIDFNEAMLEIAQKKLKGKVRQEDMRNFELNKSYDAIISLFAVFNHNLTCDEARKTLSKLKSHLKKNGVLILDLCSLMDLTGLFAF